MSMFKDVVTQSVLARGLATIFLFLVLVVALAIAAYDLIAGRDVSAMVYSVLSAGVLTSTALIGINLGIILQPAQPATSDPSATIQVTQPAPLINITGGQNAVNP